MVASTLHLCGRSGLPALHMQQRSGCGTVPGFCSLCRPFKTISYSKACTSSEGIDLHSVLREPARQLLSLPVNRQTNGYRSQIVAHGGRSVMYENVDEFVLMEPGEDEQFVTQEELQTRLKSWLAKWPGHELPEDLSKFTSLDEAVLHLVDSGCELNLGGGLGSIQWFQIRLDV